MLTAVLLVVALATTLVGVCALLLGATGERAFSQEVQRSQPHEVDVTAYLVDLPGSGLDAARATARGVVRHVLAGMHPSTVTTATSRMRQLDGPARHGYLATSDDLGEQSALTSGRWPKDMPTGSTGPVEAVAPDAAVRRLHLHLGSRVSLGSETGLGGSARPVTVVLVGTIQPTSRPVWASDPLSGAGFDPDYSDGSVAAPTYGPFVVGTRAFVGTGSNVTGLRVDAHPVLADADDASLSAAVSALDSASSLLSARAGSTARITRVASELPQTMNRIHAQEATTRSAVLAVLLLGTTLAVSALLLAGRLVGDLRAAERELLAAMGLSPRQQLLAALLEAALLAAASSVVAVPAAAVVHSLMTHLPDLTTAGLAQGPVVTPSLVVTVLVVAVALTLVLLVSPLAVHEAGRLPSRRRALARSSIDGLLLLVTLASWWQLHSRPASASSGDVVLVLAPVVGLVAVTLLVVRLLPPLLAVLAAAGSRSRALLPLAVHPAALRLSAATPMVLLSTAAAAATFGLALHGTWQQSQADQADLRTGTDFSLTFASPPSADEVDAVGAVLTRGRSGAVSPVTRRPLALGRYVGDGDAPELVALDTRNADALLRGRIDDGRTWGDVARRLVPPRVASAIPLAARGRVELTGRSPAGVPLSVVPTVVVEDATGFRSPLEGAPVDLDGSAHPMQWVGDAPAAGERVVAVQLELSGPGSGEQVVRPPVPVSVQLRVPGTDDGAGVSTWSARPLGRDSPVRGQSVSVRQAQGSTVVSFATHLDLAYLTYSSADLLASAFAPPAAVPVAVSRELVDAIGVKVGGALSATIDDTVIPLRIESVVPTVPSAPGRIAVLADEDAFSRVLIGVGHLDPAIDGFWASDRSATTTRAVKALEVGEVSTRAGQRAALARGPMQVTVPLAYLTLVAAAALLLLAGAALVVGTDQRRRSAEVARLRALGLTRGGARRLLLLEHTALLVPLVLAGVLVGGAGAVVLDASLVRSDRGTAPVPDVRLVWPWHLELVLLGCLLLGCLVVAVVAAVAQVRRSDTADLQAGEWR